MNHEHRNLLIALAGQPNVGKSTVFNMLTGARQHVANYPGVTVEKKQGTYKHDGTKVEVIDLPGTYSLTSYTQEERVARDFIILEQPEVVVVVVDASNLQRNLCLVFQVKEMGVPVVVCLNMMDVAQRRGHKLDAEKLQKELGVPVVPAVGKKNRGRDELKAAIHQTALQTHDAAHTPTSWKIDYGPTLEPVLEELTQSLTKREHLIEDFSPRWLAVKLMENDPDALRIVQHHTHDQTSQQLVEFVQQKRDEFSAEHTQPAEAIIAAQRYKQAASIMLSVSDQKCISTETTTDRIDRVVLHPIAGPIILLLSLFAFYQITMGFGGWLSNMCAPLFGNLFAPLKELLPHTDLIRPGLLASLVNEGVIGAVQSLLYYLPLFFVLFTMLAILEDSGYMARIAFLLDRILRTFGLHGQSTLPMLLGGVVVGGCSVPGIMATRAMKDEKARLVTILTIPLLNCLAKIPVYTLFVGIFFSAYKGWVMFGISMFNFVAVLLIARFLSRRVVSGEDAPFVLELSTYHLPTVTGVLRRAVERSWLFVKKLFSVIIVAMVIVWFLLTFPGIGHDREVAYDHQLETAQTQMHQQIDEKSPYADILQGRHLIGYLDFSEQYNKALQQASGHSASVAKVQEEFHSRNADMFLLANSGHDLQGNINAQAQKASNALAEFLARADELKEQRKKEIIIHSFAGRFGRMLEPVTRLAGFDWRMNIAAFTGIPAKENLVGTLGTIYSVEEGNNSALGDAIRKTNPDWSIWHALAVLVFIALFPPCVPTMLVLKNETNSWRWTIFAVLYPVVIGFGLAVLVFQIGHWMG